MLIPFLRNPVRASPNLVEVYRFRPTERWLKCVPASNHAVDAFSSISAPQGSVRKVPFACIEAEPLVYESRGVAITVARIGNEYYLAPVTIRCPLVQNEYARKIRYVHYFCEEVVRQILAQFRTIGTGHIARSQLPSSATRTNGVPSLNAEFTSLFDQPLRHVNDLNCCDGSAQKLTELPGEHFIREDPHVLGIVRDFRAV